MDNEGFRAVNNNVTTTLFKKKLSDQNSDYVFKGELMREYIDLLMHIANALLLK
jgi:hypothetical protein